MPGTFRDSSSQLKNLPQAWHSFVTGMAELCQRDEKGWQTAWGHIYQATGGARRDGSPCMGTR